MARRKKEERDTPFIGRGFAPLRENLQKKAKYVRHCNSCKHYYQTEEDDEEMCQNNHVLSYDVVMDGANIYCCYWEV